MYRNVAKTNKYDRGPKDFFRASRGFTVPKPVEKPVVNKKTGV
jgi:hypothetical protein